MDNRRFFDTTALAAAADLYGVNHGTPFDVSLRAVLAGEDPGPGSFATADTTVIRLAGWSSTTIDLAAAGTDGPFEVEVARIGTWKSMTGEKVTLDESLMEGLVSNFDPNEFIPLKKGHPAQSKTDEPSFGRVLSLRWDRARARLFATINPNSEMRRLIREGSFHNRSIEFAPGPPPKFQGLGMLGAARPSISGLAPLPADV